MSQQCPGQWVLGMGNCKGNDTPSSLLPSRVACPAPVSGTGSEEEGVPGMESTRAGGGEEIRKRASLALATEKAYKL